MAHYSCFCCCCCCCFRLEYEIERDLLTAVEHLGNGEFGEVFLANQVVGSEEDEDGYIVDIEVKRAVKTLKPNAKKQ